MNHARIVALIVGLALCLGMCVDALAQTASAPDAATVHFANGYNQLKAGDADSAVDEFKAGLKLKPDNAMAWYYLGEARLKLGSTDLAKTAFEKSIALDPIGQLADQARARLAQPAGAPQVSNSSTSIRKSESDTKADGSRATPARTMVVADMGNAFMGAPAISADGSVVVGVSNSKTSVRRLTRNGGVQDIDVVDRGFVTVSGISADGSVIIGTVEKIGKTGDDRTEYLYRWTEGEGVKYIFTPPKPKNLEISPRANSVDGAVIVGTTSERGRNGTFRVFLWTQSAGFQDLGAMGGKYAWAIGVSADGSVIFGNFLDKNSVEHPFRWTKAGGIEQFGVAGGLAVSADGAVIVGAGHDGNAFRWTQKEGLQELAPSAFATGVSADGSIIVGQSSGPFKTRAFYWTRADGIQYLDLDAGHATFLLQEAVSADGSVIAGYTQDKNLDWHMYVASYQGLVLERQRKTAELADAQRKTADQRLQAKAEAERRASEAKQQAADQAAEQEAEFQQVLTKGHPSQMYLLAVKMYSENHPDLADKLCQAIVDRYPDDPYAAKAIDRLDSVRQGVQKAAQQQQMMGQQQAFHEQQVAQQQESAQASAQQRIANCKSQCDAVENACDTSVNNQNSQAGFGALTGLLTGNKSAAYGAAGSFTDTSQCAANAQACAAGCY